MAKLALLGGDPVRKNTFLKWPQLPMKTEKMVLEILHSSNLGRYDGNKIELFENEFSKMIGANHCIAVSTGTGALEVALRACGIGGGDEVILPAYTFVATATSVLMNAAIPVFADVDHDTFCIDPLDVEKKITKRTKAIIPVHIGGNACDMEKLHSIARKNKLRIIEDACQAHLAEWSGQRVGALGDIGCFSFQSSKNISSGEGGAIVGNEDTLMDKCYSIHTCGREKEKPWYFHPHLGTNCRLTEIQAAILLAQLELAEENTRIREKNAKILSQEIKLIDGLTVQKRYASTTRHAYHLFMIHFDKNVYDGLSRDTFIKALNAEGLPCQKGYVPLHRENFVRETFDTSTYQKIYGKKYLNSYFEGLDCPVTDKLCNEESIWLAQNLLLENEDNLNDVINILRKVLNNYKELLR